MRLLSLAEIQSLEPGEAIPSFRAQLKECRKYSSGDGEYGPWTLQQLVLMDSTGTMQAKVKNKEEFTKHEVGSWFLFECVNGKHGLTGISVVEDSYQGKTNKIIAITKTCTVTDGTPQDAPSKPAAAPRTPDPRQPALPLPDTAQAILDVRERLGKAANGLIMAYDAAFYVAVEVMKKHQDAVFTPDVLEKLAVHLSISLEKNGAVHGLPTGPLSKWIKGKPAPEPPEEMQEPDEDDDSSRVPF